MPLSDKEIVDLMDYHHKPGLRLATASGLSGEVGNSKEVIDALISSAWREMRLQILADGCKQHPSYRAIRAPKGGCATCDRMHDARLELNDFDATD